MSAAAVWAGIVVRDLDVSVPWYRAALPVDGVESGDGWVALQLEGGATIELHAGDPRRPGTVFPSYLGASGPPVMPGFGMHEPAEAAAALPVVRTFPNWLVVVVSDGLRVVLTDRDSDKSRGLVGFAFRSPDPRPLVSFLDRIGQHVRVQQGEVTTVVPVIAAERDEDLLDPDGTVLWLRRGAPDGSVSAP